jgi:hypothetical protein
MDLICSSKKGENFMAKAPASRITRRKGKRATRKKLDMGTVQASLEAVASSKVTRDALKRYKLAANAASRADRSVEVGVSRVTKAKEAVASAKTPAAKAKSRERVAAVRAVLLQAKARARTVAGEFRTAEHLLLTLYKAHEKAFATYTKAYEKAAQAATKSAGKKPRRRKPTVKRAAKVV